MTLKELDRFELICQREAPKGDRAIEGAMLLLLVEICRELKALNTKKS